MIYQFALVGLGGALGSICRFAIQKWWNAGFPYGTLLVNVSGCFLVGLIWALAMRGLGENIKIFLMAGFCGGFTTFSAFSQESVGMLMNGRWLGFALYVTVSLAAGLLAAIAGFKILN